MTKWPSLILSVVITLFPALSMAHDHHHDHNQKHRGNWSAYTETEIAVDGDIDPDELARELVDEIHEISHDHGERKNIGAFVRGWGKNLNLLKSGRDLLRWVDHRIHVQPALTEHAKNLGVIFGLSHAIETISGPVGAAVGLQAGLPDAVNWAILTVGGIISIPGLDPVCIALAAAYKGSDGFRAKITKIRVVLIRASVATARGLRLPQLASRFGFWKPGVERTSDFLSVHTGLTAPGTSGGTISFSSTDGTFYLDQVTVHDPGKFQVTWNSVKSEVDWNTWHAVKELIALRESDEPPFYVESVNPPNHYKILPGAIRPRGKWRWCDNLLHK